MIIKNIQSGEKSEEFNLAGAFYPNQFITRDELKKPAYIKKTMDFFAGRAFQQLHQRKTIIKNYKLRNGEFDFSDYSGHTQDDRILDSLLEQAPKDAHYYLKHYPIINSPLNTLQGEMIGRPRKERVKAIDALSASEILEFRTNLLYQAAVSKLSAKYEGKEDENGELPEEYYKELQSKITSYSTSAENWGNKALTAFKYFFNYSEKNEDGFMDLLTSSEEYHHFYPDNSKLGFKYEVENPINVWYLGTANAKYTSDCWAVGTIKLRSISELIDIYKLDEKEIAQLTTREISMDGNPMYNVFTPTHPDPNLFNWSLNLSLETLTDATLLNSFSFGNQQYHAEVVAYWKGKKKIFKRTFLDEEGYQRTQTVDEMYKFDKEYGDIKLEEEWMNVWYKSVRIGPYVYKEIELLEFNDTCPIVGIVNSTKNTKGRSFLDLMKPYQVMFNVCLNNVWELLSKDLGVVFLGDIKLVPDKDSANPIEQMLFTAKERGMIFVDTSVDNTGGNVQFNQFSAVNLSRSQEIQQRIVLADAMVRLCWKLVGVSDERTGDVLASQTATGTNASLQQSFAQTEPLFKLHEDLQQKVLQSALNIMQWVELKKPESILNYLNSDLDNVFIKITKNELLRDLWVFVTNSKEDKQNLETLKSLMQPAMQNGADLLEMFEILSLNSENKLKDILKNIQERKDNQLKQAQELEQQKMQQEKEMFDAQQETAERHHREAIENENINKQLDREMQIRKAEISALGFDSNDQTNGDDIINSANAAVDLSRELFDQHLRLKELNQKDRELDLKNKDIDTKLKIAKENKTKAEMARKKATKKK